MTKGTVLLVEDDRDNRTIYRTILERVGYAVVEAEDGEAAVRLAQEVMPDVILMDVSIPVLDGWEATRRLKGNPATARIPIVALTAHALDADRTMAERVGCDGFLAKPIEPRRVVEEVERMMGTTSGGPSLEYAPETSRASETWLLMSS